MYSLKEINLYFLKIKKIKIKKYFKH
jgi:hypothetical protein